MEPMRIQCVPIGLVAYPIPAGVWLMLDSLIYRAALLDRLGEEYYVLPPLSPASTELLDVPVPLARREVGTSWYYAPSPGPIANPIAWARQEAGMVWYYACSWANVEASSLGQHVTNWVRGYPATDAVHYLSGKGRLLIKTWQGEDKLYNMPLHCYTVEGLTWYAVGDLAEIKRLLETYYLAIGKKSAYGQGQLAYYPDGSRWRVEPWPEDWSEIDGDGQQTRGLPIKVEEGAWPLDMVRCGIRPPYYLHAHQFFVRKLT